MLYCAIVVDAVCRLLAVVVAAAAAVAGACSKKKTKKNCCCSVPPYQLKLQLFLSLNFFLCHFSLGFLIQLNFNLNFSLSFCVCFILVSIPLWGFSFFIFWYFWNLLFGIALRCLFGIHGNFVNNQLHGINKYMSI